MINLKIEDSDIEVFFEQISKNNNIFILNRKTMFQFYYYFYMVIKQKNSD